MGARLCHKCHLPFYVAGLASHIASCLACDDSDDSEPPVEIVEVEDEDVVMQGVDAEESVIERIQVTSQDQAGIPVIDQAAVPAVTVTEEPVAEVDTVLPQAHDNVPAITTTGGIGSGRATAPYDPSRHGVLCQCPVPGCTMTHGAVQASRWIGLHRSRAWAGGLGVQPRPLCHKKGLVWQRQLYTSEARWRLSLADVLEV